MRKIYFSRTQNGQTLLIVLLAMTTIITISLSVVSRSISDVAVTTETEESLRAFSAAEAGVEEALIEQVQYGETIEKNLGESGEDSEYQAEVVSFPSESPSTYLYPFELTSGETATFWLVGHDSNGSILQNSGFTGTNLRMLFAEEGKDTPALELAIVYQDRLGRIHSTRVGFDPIGSRRNSNHFLASQACSACEVEGIRFRYQAELNFNDLLPDAHGTPWNSPGGLKIIRARLLYISDTQSLAVLANNTFPTQGRKIQSTGVAGSAERKVEVYELFSDIPEIFDSALFSQNSILK